jgi:hypothetical protein
MFQALAGRDWLDRMAIGLSGLCLVHCVGTALVLALLASVGGILGDPLIHEVGLMLAILLAAIALGRGILTHGFMLPSAIGGLGLGVMGGAASLPHLRSARGGEMVYTMIGVAIVALGHDLNRRALI